MIRIEKFDKKRTLDGEQLSNLEDREVMTKSLDPCKGRHMETL
jgi:hypothetical protein